MKHRSSPLGRNGMKGVVLAGVAVSALLASACEIEDRTLSPDDPLDGAGPDATGDVTLPPDAQSDATIDAHPDGSGDAARDGDAFGEDASDASDACPTGNKRCAGACVAIVDPNFGCGATTCDKSSCPAAGTGGTLACSSGVCVIDTCGTGTKKCGGRCVGLDDPNFGCGPTTCDATTCPAPGAGTLVCAGGACIIGSCGTGTKKCGSSCVPTDVTNGCGDATRCTACASNESCTGAAPTKCACVPDNVQACQGKACGSAVNNCGATIQCPNTCVAPSTCGGGGAGANACGCTKVNPCTGGKCGSLSDACGGAVSCTCPTGQTCGGGGAGLCGCVSNPTASCSGKACGTTTDNCGATITCPNTCTAAPNTVVTCAANACVHACPTGSTALSCSTAAAPSCGEWLFDSTDPANEGWSVTMTSGTHGALHLITVAGRKVLALDNVVLPATPAPATISFAVKFCANNGVVVIGGKSLSFDLSLVGTSGTINGTDDVTANGIAETTAIDGPNIVTGGAWKTYPFTFGPSSGSQAGMHILVHKFDLPWSGSIYFDNIHF